MRISDWSSDVCSSDLPKQAKLRGKQLWHWIYNRGATDFTAMTDIAKAQHPWLKERFVIGRPEVIDAQVSEDGTRKWLLRRSEETTSELQSLMHNSSADFCLKKQKQTTTEHTQT